MIEPGAFFYFDAVDPLSFLMDREIRLVENATGLVCLRLPLEVRPAPALLTDTSDLVWAPRWAEAARLAESAAASGRAPVSFARPTLVPRSLKAHEFLLHAEASTAGLGRTALESVFSAFLLEGKDIGRVDVLVDIGRSLGLDQTETKAVLDVDRYEAEASQFAAEALESSIGPAPCLLADGRRLEGFHNQATIGTFLAAT